jgi:SAM-dependent methyltransferase
MPEKLRDVFGDIDVYLFDQLLKGRFTRGMRILDAGCGAGRNLIYLLRCQYDLFGIDESAASIDQLRDQAARLAPALPAENFRVGDVRSLPFADGSFDVVISNAVLHFAANDRDFRRMLTELWRVLKAGGILFARLASTIGIENRIREHSGRRFLLPDGSERYLVDQESLLSFGDELQATLIEPIKTVNVQNERCMTTWCLRKSY